MNKKWPTQSQKKFKIILAWKRMHQVVNKHLTVQTSLLLKTFAKTPILFCKVWLRNVSLPLASLKLSWKSVGGTGALVARASWYAVMGFLHWWSTSNAAWQTGQPSQRSSKAPERDSERPSYVPLNEQVHIQPMQWKKRRTEVSNLWLKPW